MLQPASTGGKVPIVPENNKEQTGVRKLVKLFENQSLNKVERVQHIQYIT